MTKKQQVLDTIRNLCPELVRKSMFSYKEFSHLVENPPEDTYLEIQLNHLLLALDKINFEESPNITVEGQFVNYNPETGSMILTGIFYNMSESLEKNLDNPELLDLIYDLICKK